jgi:hypothetical protein
VDVHDRSSESRSAHRADDRQATRVRARSSAVLDLQRSIGNAALVRALLQARSPDDSAEPASVQRAAVRDVLRSAGRPLDPAVREDMEARLGADFSRVRIHTGPAASRSANGIGAQAYTSREHVVLGDGAADRHTLAHELTHVIQQRQGPVAGTDNGEGLRVSHPHDHHEQAAEANARHALQRHPADLGDSTPKVPAAHAVPAPDDLVIQRKVGFEFETGWYVDTAVKKWLIAGKKEPGKPLKRHDPIGPPFNGFRLEADETDYGRTEVEFVVEPPVEEGDRGEQRLRNVMAGVTQVGRQMERAARATPVDEEKLPEESPAQLPYFRQHKATGRVQDKPFMITPQGPLSAGAQVTTGLALHAIPMLGVPLLDHPNQDRPSPPALELPAPMTQGAQMLRIRADNVQGNSALPLPSQQLKGLVAVIASYLIRGATSRPLPYPKQVGGLLMARTDFGRLFQLLPRNEQEFLRDDPEVWVDLVVEAAARDSSATFIDPRNPVIRSGTRQNGAVTLTIRQWLKAMVRNQDLLTQIKGSGSMGAMGSKIEGVGPGAQEDAGIFEFRASQLVKIPLDAWADFALDAHKYITRLHGG